MKPRVWMHKKTGQLFVIYCPCNFWPNPPDPNDYEDLGEL